MTDGQVHELRAVIGELGRVLDKLGDQLAATVQEADRECRTIGIAFRKMATANRRLAAIPLRGPAAKVLEANCTDIDAAMNDAIVALQYQDLLAQRVFHIRAGLDQIQGNLRDGTQRSYRDWLEFLRRVERLHHTEQQKLRTAQPLAESSVDLF